MTERRVKHESFGFIRASRTSGHTELFDSALKHQHYVTIEVGHAEQEIRHGQSYIHGGFRGEIVSLGMSEAQFAQFITSMNVGSGSPCTLQYVGGKRIASPPADANTRESFEGDIRERGQALLNQCAATLIDIENLLAKGKANKTELGSIKALVSRLRQEMESNMPFFMSQFAETMEKLTERAKMDLNAHAAFLGQRLQIGEDSEKPTLIDA